MAGWGSVAEWVGALSTALLGVAALLGTILSERRAHKAEQMLRVAGVQLNLVESGPSVRLVRLTNASPYPVRRPIVSVLTDGRGAEHVDAMSLDAGFVLMQGESWEAPLPSGFGETCFDEVVVTFGDAMGQTWRAGLWGPAELERDGKSRWRRRRDDA